MIIPINEDFRKNGMQDGSNMKRLKNTGGAGKGLMALGFCLYVLGVAIFAATFMADMIFQGIVVFVPAAVIGSLFVAGGFLLQKKQVAGYLNYFSKGSGYSVEELEDFDREIQTDDVVILSAHKKLNKEACKFAGVITEHWMKAPCAPYVLLKIADIAAIWHDSKSHPESPYYGPLLIIVRSDGKIVYVPVKADLGEEVISEITKRNPVTIPVRNFEIHGRQFDAYIQNREVADIYREEFKRQMNS